jgi:hypothetical protein
MIAPSGNVTIIAGKQGIPGNLDGVGDVARFGRLIVAGPIIGLNSLVRNPSGDLFAYDTGNRSLRRLALSGTNWIVSTVTSFFDTNMNQVELSDISALASDDQGNLLAVEGYAIRKFVPDGTNWIVSTLAGLINEPGLRDGPGTEARFGVSGAGISSGPPRGLTVDRDGNVFVSDTAHHTVRKIASNGNVTTLAGIPRPGSQNGTGASVRFLEPRGIAVDSLGNLYVADFRNFTFRKGFPAPFIETAQASPAYLNGAFHLSIVGPSDQLAILQWSTNLYDWKVLSTNASGTSIQVVDEAARDFTKRFYRVAFP